MAMPDPTIVFSVTLATPTSEAFGAAYTIHQVGMMNVDAGQTDASTQQSYGDKVDPHLLQEGQRLAWMPGGVGTKNHCGQSGAPMGNMYSRDTICGPNPSPANPTIPLTAGQVVLYGSEAIYARDMYCLPNSANPTFGGKATPDRAWLKVVSINGATS